MKSMKKFLAVAMILLMTAALAACGGDTKDSGSSDSSADAPKASGDVLIVGTEPTFPPFDTTDDNGDIVGFDMDLIKAIGKDQGFEVEFRNLEFDGLIPALTSGYDRYRSCGHGCQSGKSGAGRLQRLLL